MQIASLVTLACAAAVGVSERHSSPAQPLALFTKSLVAGDLPRAIAICENGLLPPGSDINVSAIRSLLDDYPDSVNLLACIYQKGVVPMPPDGGAELLFVAASKQHVRLAVALVTLGSPLERPHVDTASGAGVFHAALLNRLLTLDIVHRTLVAQGSDSEADRPSSRKSTVAWLEAKGEAVARHLSPPSAGGVVRAAVASLVAVASGSRIGVVSGPDPVADLRAVRADDAQSIANGLSFLLVRILLDALAKQSSSVARQGATASAGHVAHTVQADGAIVDVDTRPSVYEAPEVYQALCAAASAVRSLRAIQQPDHYGRTPLHAAAATGNVAAIRALVEAHYMLSTRAFTALATTPRHWCQVHSADNDYKTCCADIELAAGELQDNDPASATRTRLSRFVSKQDARGFTPIDAACHAGYDDAAAALEAAKMKVTVKSFPASQQQADATALPWLLQSVPSWAEAYARRGWQRSTLCAAIIDSEPPALQSTPPPLGAPQDDSMLSVPDLEPLADGGWTTPRHVPFQAAEAVTAVMEREKTQWPGVSLGENRSGDGHDAALFSNAAVATADAFLCDFDVVDGTALPGISAAAFQARYQARGLPVLLRGLAAQWPLRSAWTRSGLVDGPAGTAAFGNVGRVPYAAAFGASPAALISEVTLAAFIESLLSGGGGAQQQPSCMKGEACAQTGAAPAPLYVFDSPASPAARRAALTLDAQRGGGSSAGAAALMATLELVPQFLRGDVLLLKDASELRPGAMSQDNSGDPLVRPSPAPKPQVFVGGPGSGAPLHYHTDAWNVVAWGRKHWWLLPPAAGAYSSEPAASWAKRSEAAFARLGVGGAPFECVQQAGDVLFVPAGWAHAVLNTGENVTVGAAVELALGYPGPAGWVRLH